MTERGVIQPRRVVRPRVVEEIIVNNTAVDYVYFNAPAYALSRREVQYLTMMTQLYGAA